METFKTLVLPTSAVVVTILYVLTAMMFFARIKRRRLERSMRFRESLRNGFKNRAIESLEDLVNVYKGIHGLSGDDSTYKGDLARHLRGQIASLAASETATSGMQAAEIAQFRQKLTSYVRQIETENPFADLPSAERTLLQDIREMVKANAVDGALRKLDDIASLVQVRQESVDKLTSLNKWSTPLAVIGLVLTVVFGVASFI